MEFAMFDKLIEDCKDKNLVNIIGIYKRTNKNDMVSSLFSELGFKFVKEEFDGSIVWEFEIIDHKQKQTVIKIN